MAKKKKMREEGKGGRSLVRGAENKDVNPGKTRSLKAKDVGYENINNIGVAKKKMREEGGRRTLVRGENQDANPAEERSLKRKRAFGNISNSGMAKKKMRKESGKRSLVRGEQEDANPVQKRSLKRKRAFDNTSNTGLAKKKMHQQGGGRMLAKNLEDELADNYSDKIHAIVDGDDVCTSDPFGFSPVLDKISVAEPPPVLNGAPADARILCFVNSNEKYHQDRVPSILETWGPKCDKLVFASSVTDEKLGAVQIPNADYSYAGLWSKHRETLRFIYNKYGHEYDWFFKADDDTYVLMENLREFLDSKAILREQAKGTPLHIGNPVAMYVNENGVNDEGRTIDDQLLGAYLERSGYKFIFNVGGAGYVMNKPFLRNMADWIDRDECGPTKELSELLDDSMISLCSSNFGAYPYAHTRDEDGLERFNQDSPRDLFLAEPGTLLYRMYTGGKQYTGGFQYGEDCCSKKSISFHHLEPNEIRAMHKMLYDCRGVNASTKSSSAEAADHPDADSRREDILEPSRALEEDPTWPPLATTRRIARRSKKAVIIVLNCGMLDFADNLVASIMRFEVENVILVPLDDTAYQVLAATYPDNVIPPPPQFQTSSELSRLKPATWGTNHFRDLSSARAWILLQFLQMDITVLYNDVDMLWQANLFDVLEEKKHEERSSSSSTTSPLEAFFMEDRYGMPDHICSCFLYLEPTSANQRFLEDWAARSRKSREESLLSSEERPGDQNEMNKAILQMKDFSYRVLNGENDFMPTGKEYFEEWDSDKKSKALLIHNNWIITKWRKYFRYLENRLWYPSGRLDGVKYQCESGSVTIQEQAAKASSSLTPQTVLQQQTIPSHKRTLVVLLGAIRGGEPAWNSLYRHVLEPNQADLALVVGAGAHSSPLFQKAKYIWTFPEYEDWNNAFDENFGMQDTKEMWRRLGGKLGGFSPFGAQSGGTILGFAKAVLLERLKQFRLLDKYDFFVITRTDQYYECDFDVSSLDPSKVYVPTEEDWGGICDRFVATGRGKIEAVLNTHLPALRNPEPYFDSDRNAESFIKLRWQEEGIWKHVERFRRIMFTAYQPGAKSRWGGGSIQQAFVEDDQVVNLKYADEYYQAMSCRDWGGAITVNSEG